MQEEACTVKGGRVHRLSSGMHVGDGGGSAHSAETYGWAWWRFVKKDELSENRGLGKDTEETSNYALILQELRGI